MRINIIAPLVCALLIAGCASQKIELSAAPGQNAIIRDGIPALVSKKKNIVMLRPNKTLLKGNPRPAFTVAVRNLGNKPETLLESNITARQTIDGKQVAMRVYRYDELVQEEQTRQAWQAFGVALSGAARAMNAANAGYVQTTGTVHGYGAYGPTYANYSATTYDPLRAQLAQNVANAETQSDIANLQAQGEQNLAALEHTILKDNTVMPGEWVGGTIVLDPPAYSGKAPKSYTITVDFGGEQHEFQVAQVAN
jgi:hypothetical protein